MAFLVNVPSAPGVPLVSFAPGAGQILKYLTGDSAGIYSGTPLKQPWGLYSGGSPVILADNVVRFDYRQQWAISDFPVERGAFASFDKVSIPFDARFQFSTGGSESRRLAFIESIKAVAGTLDLFNVVTPDAIFPNVCITHWSYSQSANSGVGLLVVDLWTTEIRETSNSTQTSVQSPTSAAMVNGGTVQTTPATPDQVARFGPVQAAGG